jgi:hypothetical protein
MFPRSVFKWFPEFFRCRAAGQCEGAVEHEPSPIDVLAAVAHVLDLVRALAKPL